MPVNLNMDSLIGTLRNAQQSAVGFANNLQDFVRRFQSDQADNPFGTAAVKDVGTDEGDIPMLNAQGQIDASMLPVGMQGETGPPGDPGIAGAGVTVKDDGTTEGTPNTVRALNFTGDGVSVTRSGNEVDIAVAEPPQGVTSTTLLEWDLTSSRPTVNRGNNYQFPSDRTLSPALTSTDDNKTLYFKFAFTNSSTGADDDVPSTPEHAFRAGDWRTASNNAAMNQSTALFLIPLFSTAGGFTAGEVMGIGKGPNGRIAMFSSSGNEELYLTYARVRLVG